MTDRVRELEATVARLTTMLANAPCFVSQITVDGRILYLNRLSPGFRMEDVLGTSVLEYIPPDFHERAIGAIRAAAETRMVQSYSNAGAVSATEFGHYVTHVAPVIDGDAVTSLVMVATDVSDLVLARAELHESKLRLEVAMDATGLGIWTLDPAIERGTWDPICRRIFGVDAGDAPGLAQLMAERVHPEDRQRVKEGLVRALHTGVYDPIEHRIVLSDGSVRWVAASGRFVRLGDGGRRLIGGVRDITDQRALEARLLEAQKLEAIGRLAGGIAHDFNNLLTAILGNIDLALSSPDEARPLLEDARLAAERSAALTAQLLGFARRQMIAPKLIDPSARVSRLTSLLRRLVGGNLEVVTDLRARSAVTVDPSQFEQVLLNLATNARDAMPRSGTLTIRTADTTLDGPTARAYQVEPGPFVLVSVTDTGDGIAAEDLAQIFEPFFSTRPRGTGLGLATCYGIVKQNRGHIVVESAPGEGASFTVYLPAEARGPAPVPDPLSSVVPARKGERVLVVEDEPLVRSVIRRALENAGYEVRVVATPAEALSAHPPAPWALLVSDLVLPGMDGRELARRMGERWPMLRVILISGYTESGITDDREQAAGSSHRFLQKPFLPSTFLAVVREVLDGTTDRLP